MSASDLSSALPNALIGVCVGALAAPDACAALGGGVGTGGFAGASDFAATCARDGVADGAANRAAVACRSRSSWNVLQPEPVIVPVISSESHVPFNPTIAKLAGCAPSHCTGIRLNFAVVGLN